MELSTLVSVFSELEKTSSGNELRKILASFFKKTSKKDVPLIAQLVLGKIASDYSGIVLGVAETFVLRSIGMSSTFSYDRVLKRYQQVGDVGIVASEFVGKRRKALTVEFVFSQLHKIAAASGGGSQEVKVNLLAQLLRDASPVEAKYICRLVLGQLRLGVADKTVLDSLALAFIGKKDDGALSYAYAICPDVSIIASTLISKGISGIRKIGVHVGRPVQSMLCQRVDSLTEAAKRLGLPFVAEEKYDGERIQAHKDGERVVLFSRRLDDVTLQFPDIAATVRKLNAKTLVLDCEAMPVDPETGKLLPFQVLMSRRRKHGVAEAVDDIPVTLFVFDILYLDGKSLLDVPYEKRIVAVQKLVHTTKAVSLTTRVVCKNTDTAEELFNKVLENGGEGIVMKSLSGNYEAGERSWNWVKWKPAYTKELRDTFDLVIIGGFHGTGKKGGMLSSYLCAAYDKKTDMFYSFCKVASGFSEADLALLPEKLAKYKTNHKPARVSVGKTMTPDVWFEPAIVIEVVGDEVTQSPNHTAGGLALRFPRFLKYRNDKKAEQATTVVEIKKMAK